MGPGPTALSVCARPAVPPRPGNRRFSPNSGDIVLDPFSGSGTTLVVAEQLGRKWLGCEIDPEYNKWTIERLNNIQIKTKDEWIEFDKTNEKRRNSIR